MTIPVWVLLAFAAWTLLVLVTTHATYRWWRILTGKAQIQDFGAYKVEGVKGWYTRGMRAHANCVENLPVYGAIVLAIIASGIESTALDVLALVVIGARIPHTLVHVVFEQTNLVTSFRFLFFVAQWIAMTAMIIVVALNA